MYGYDFHRQKPIDNYILDFFLYELMLGIEVDGYSHEFWNLWKGWMKENEWTNWDCCFEFSDEQV
jgi:hypothetical protein